MSNVGRNFRYDLSEPISQEASNDSSVHREGGDKRSEASGYRTRGNQSGRRAMSRSGSQHGKKS